MINFEPDPSYFLDNRVSESDSEPVIYYVNNLNIS